MNERIKILAKQAVSEGNLPESFWWVTQDPKMEKVAEKFAELLAKECLDTIADNRFELPTFIIEKVKHRFGVK